MIINVFTYWHSTNIPKLNKYCIESWKKHNPNINIVIINEKNVNDYINELPIKYRYLSHQHKADFIRFYVLHHYGGIWLDNTIIINTSFDKIFDMTQKNKAQFIRSDSYRMTYKPNNYPSSEHFFENSMICSLNKKNKYIEAVLLNFSFMINNINHKLSNNENGFSNCSYFIRSYKKLNISHMFLPDSWTYYLTCMNIMSLVLMKKPFLFEYVLSIDKRINFICMFNPNDKNDLYFRHDDNHLKLSHVIREIIEEQIEIYKTKKVKNTLMENLSNYIDFDYFL
jgi:mannosyltransferase OCH1-like enzyme